MAERWTNPTPWHREMRGTVVEAGLELNDHTDGVLALCGAEIERLLARNAALVETLKGAWCPVDNRARVGECQQCGCSAGILIASEQPAAGPPRLIQGGARPGSRERAAAGCAGHRADGAPQDQTQVRGSARRVDPRT